MTEHQYILLNGGDDIIGQSIIYQSSHARRSVDLKDSEVFNQQLGKIVQKNSELRAEYWRKVDAGEIHNDTVVEQLFKNAGGHEDNESTHAARRCLAKRGIAYGSI